MPHPMQHATPAPDSEPAAEDSARFARTALVGPGALGLRSGLGAACAALGTSVVSALVGSLGVGVGFGLAVALAVGLDGLRRASERERALGAALGRLERDEPLAPEPAAGEAALFLERLRVALAPLAESRERGLGLARRVGELARDLDRRFESMRAAALRQEESIEETASLSAHMRTSMVSIGEQVEELLEAADESASSVLQMASAIEEVAQNSALLHDSVEASTSSIHEMGASIRQVAEAAEQVEQMAEETAAAVTQMDRSIQEVSAHADEAATLTQRAHAGAESGGEAVAETIADIERIATATNEAKERLSVLVSRISEIGDILAAIDAINDETNLLSLNAAIIAAQAGEQGKAFLVVANHVKTLARRTAGSTQDIERLIADIEVESGSAVRAMEAGIAAVATGVERSQIAGDALATIRESCRDASERVDEIARATAEQSRNSKGVAASTQQTSTHIQQISQAIAQQRTASEAMLNQAERARGSCEHVHRSTEEQRTTSRHITRSISAIRDRIRAIGEQTTVHSRANENLAAAAMTLLENAQQVATGLEPARAELAELEREAQALLGSGPIPGARAEGPEPSGPQRVSSATASPAR